MPSKHRKFFLSTVILEMFAMAVRATIDINLPEFEYLAAHLSAKDCQRLVVALHFEAYDLPETILDEAVDKTTSKRVPNCLEQLLHWNGSPGEGHGKTHHRMEHRLRQIGRDDLADWLGKTAFRQLSDDLLEAVEQPFGEIIPTVEPDPDVQVAHVTGASNNTSGTDAQIEQFHDELRLVVEAVAAGLTGGLIFSLVCLLGMVVIERVSCRCPYNSFNDDDDDDDDDDDNVCSFYDAKSDRVSISRDLVTDTEEYCKSS